MVNDCDVSLTFWFFTIDFHSLSSKKFVFGGHSPGPPPLGAATDNAARYTVTSSSVPSMERNISLDCFWRFQWFWQAEKLGKFNYPYINNCLILAL